MRICLVSSDHGPAGGIGQSRRRLATLLAERHEVTLIHSGGVEPERWTPPDSGVREVFVELSPQLAGSVFSCEDHRLSAAVLAAIEKHYPDGGPDYVEVPDYRAHGLVPMQARRAGHPLLRETAFAVQICSASELMYLHDRNLSAADRATESDLEREQWRLADRIVWRGGDTLDLYRRYYPFELPEAVCIRAPFERPPAAPPAARRPTDGPLRMLYAGRLQRVKGAMDLAQACLRLSRDDWELTMIGGDTPSAPLGQSVAATIEAMFGGDPRLTLAGEMPYAELQRCYEQFDLLVVPSRFEVWSNVTVEAMRAGLPILATPTGGPAELIAPGVTGWHTADCGPWAIRAGIERLLEDRDEVERVRSSGAVYERFLEFTDRKQVLDAYDRMLSEICPEVRRRMRPSKRSAEPLVTGVIPYFRAAKYVGAAVESLLAQTHTNLEVMIVNDGSFEADDSVLAELSDDPRVRVVTQLNGGESSARNLGIGLARGDYVVTLDADNELEPEFVARALEILGREPDLAYVSCWLRFIDSDGAPAAGTAGYAPLGNRVLDGNRINGDGDAIAVFPRSVFAEEGFRYEPDAAIQADWALYRTLRSAGRFGLMIPDWLLRYRVLEESVLRAHDNRIQARSWNEALDALRMRHTRWMADV